MRAGQFNAMKRKEAILGYLFASPWLLGLLVFTVYPIFSSLYFSFTQYNTLKPPTWVGINNYKFMFTSDPLFWKSLYNTVYYVIFSVPLTIIVGVLVALLLNQSIFGMRVYRTIFYLPNVVSIVATALLWQWIFDPTFGPINQFLGWFGVEGPGWLTDEAWSKPALIIMSTWGIGGGVIINLAALKDVPVSLYEAATLDGATPLKKFWHVTLPMISPTIYFNLIMGLIGGFQVFVQAFIMTGGGPVNSTYFYAYHLYQKAFSELQMGYASALAWVLLVVVLSVTLLVMKISNRWVFYSGDSQ